MMDRDFGDGDDKAPPLPPRRAELPKPVAVPATSSSLGSPFLRAYPPVLHEFGISRKVFLTFLDDLNRVAVRSPPLIMVSAACGVAGFVPDITTQAIALGIDATANASMYALSKGRTEMMLRKANRDIFHRHGLKVQVAKLEAVALLAGMPILDEDNVLLKDAAILAPYEDIHELHTLSGQQRRLKTFQPWLSPLDIEELPEIEERRVGIGKMSVALSEWQRGHGEKKLMADRRKALDKRTESIQKAEKRYQDDMESILQQETKIVASQGGLTEEDRIRLQEKRRKAVDRREIDLYDAERRYTKGNKEEKGIRRIYFLLLTRSDEDLGGMDELMARAESEDEADSGHKRQSRSTERADVPNRENPPTGAS
ncbi:uncharacterized protein F5Z01DRAFT_147833 [Emericellopsis atlantica]|uniref:Uncharacterized protein n=1 Tax=Emericellopsis atlantica TaxID=2614577 RepID=A0A9P7ZKX4_9HYPO|nr:uncharacterized protein F5Z01DRAFT_147833 [Emericellopsis atlantica]KAG9253592.1 hypothetical protein F5Z01DRAFT_147833 [Emericellopsis atlantica]